jgi:serine/threonine-protein kinase
MSPSRSLPTRPDGRSDLYALGCVLFEMLIGERRSAADTRSHARTRWPVEFPHGHTIYRVEHAAHAVGEDAGGQVRDGRGVHRGTRLPNAAADDGPSRPTRFIWRLRLRRALPLITAGLLVLLAATQGVPWLRRDVRGTPSLDATLVAIMPFALLGARRPRPQLRRISELLYVRLPGDVGPRAVYPATVATALKRGGHAETLPLKDALEVARSLGAGRLLVGQIGAADDQLVLSATLYGVPGGDEVARTRDITGPADSLLPMVDRLAAELLSRGAGESEQRLSDLVTTNLPALRAYLVGKEEFSRGRYTEAARHFNEALDIDSTFALAALSLTTTGAFVRTEGTTRGKPLAWAARDRLGPRDRCFHRPAGPRYPAQSSEREHLEAWEDAVETQVDRVEPWHQLGEVLLHSGSWLGITGTRERAAAAFARALALDSTFAPSLAHTLDIAAQEGDTAAVRSLSARYFAIDSIGDLADFYRWRTAVALSDRKRLERIRARFPEMAPPALERIVAIAQLDGIGMADVLLAAEALRRTSVSGRDAQWAQVKMREVALNRGRPREAARIVQESRDRSRNVEFYALSDVVEALYWGADSAAAAAVVRERAASADAPVPAGSTGTSPQYFDICSVNLWRVAHGELQPVPAAIAKLRLVQHPLDQFPTGYIAVCALVLETRLAAAQGSKDLPALLDRLDSLAQTGPASTSWLVVAANLTVAELRERQGDLPRALAAARRRVSQYDLGEPRVLVGLSTFLREEGRLAALTGDRQGALRAYNHYLSLRDEPEAAALPGSNGCGRRCDLTP